ncbi:hypothetical protein VNO77_47974 [Canavalia gladiata]|uniref:Uncharacterized protein n=1 Tax=Canavalia gladiata TaxID=3824 RepID=A0AAN9JF41_CANGL
MIDNNSPRTQLTTFIVLCSPKSNSSQNLKRFKRVLWSVRDPWMPKASLGSDQLPSYFLYVLDSLVSVESFSGMFRSSFPLLRKSKPPVQVQDTILTAWTIRHPTRNRNDPIARAELYQLSYIPPSQVEDLAREVNHRTYSPTNLERINRFLFGSDSSFRTQHTTIRCTALSKCACSPFFLTMASLYEITPMRRKKKALRDPPGPTLDTLRSFFKPAPISSQEIDK